MSERIRGRVVAYGISIVLLVLVGAPLLGLQSADSFPLSTYPMFSGKRTSALTSVPHAIGVREDGEREVLSPDILGTDEVIQAYETLRQAIGEGDAAVQRLCQDAASRVDGGSFTSIEIVTDTFDGLTYFEGGRKPIASQPHGSCQVPS